MVFILLVNLCFETLLGQNIAVIDSLKFVLKNQEDTIKVNTLNELSWELRKNKPEEAISYAKNAKKLSDSLSYSKGSLTSLNRLGQIYISKKDNNRAEEIYINLLAEEIKQKNHYGIGRAYNQLGIIFSEKKKFKIALDYTLKAYGQFKKLGKTNVIAIISNNIGDLYRELGDYDKAMSFFIESLKLKKAQNNKEGVALTLQNIAIFQIELENHNKALTYLNESKQIFEKLNDEYELAKVYKNLGVTYFNKAELDSALFCFRKSIKLKEKLNLHFSDSEIYNNLGTIYHKKELYDDALKVYKKSLKNNPTTIVYNNIGHIYSLKKDYLKSSKSYKEALFLSKKSGQKVEEMETLKHLSNVYYERDILDSALWFNKQYLGLRNNIDTKYKLAMNIKSDNDEHEKLLADLGKKEAENKRKTTFIYSLIVGLILISLLFFAILRGNRQKQLKTIAQKKRLIEEQKVEKLLKGQELKSINAMMLGQEKERKRIARDLHDRLGSMLSMVKIHFKSVEENIESLKTINLDLYKNANKLLDEACDEVRKISQDIDSGILTKFGLVAALEDLKYTLEKSKQLEIEFISHGFESRLPLNVEIGIYRIIQELISNILKHAKANEISIQILKVKDLFNIIVEDNGIGFNTDVNYSGMGLKNIESRVDSFKGILKIDSRLNEGTTVSIDLPLKNNLEND